MPSSKLVSGFRFQVSGFKSQVSSLRFIPGGSQRPGADISRSPAPPSRFNTSPFNPTMKITKQTQFQNGVSNVKSGHSEVFVASAWEKRTQFLPDIPRGGDSLSPPFPPAQGGSSGPPHEPSAWSAAFTPLQLPIVQELFTLKRPQRRAPVQGFNARIVLGKSLPVGDLPVPVPDVSGPAGTESARLFSNCALRWNRLPAGGFRRPAPKVARSSRVPQSALSSGLPRRSPAEAGALAKEELRNPHSKIPNEFAKIQPNPT